MIINKFGPEALNDEEKTPNQYVAELCFIESSDKTSQQMNLAFIYLYIISQNHRAFRSQSTDREIGTADWDQVIFKCERQIAVLIQKTT
jgi:hypothetical protein